jgi:glycogen debranching enzyme
MGQPYLHEHLVLIAAPATWLSRSSGQVVDGVDGLYVDDRRVLSRFVVTVNGLDPVPLSARLVDASTARFVGVLPALGDGGPDPTVLIIRTRTVTPTGGTEEITLDNRARGAVDVDIVVAAGTDFAPMGLVKAGRSQPMVDGWRAPDGARAEVVADPPVAPSSPASSSASSSADAPGAGPLWWRVTIPARSSWTVRLSISRVDAAPRPAVGGGSSLRVSADDRRLDELVRQSVADLDALRLPDGDDVYYAAGSPWYMTLFGRDSLWTARLALPLGWQVAAGTLRALARRQGARADRLREEEPGKILHEVRPPDAATSLPPVYYGSVDSTALFVSTLADAYRWGMPAASVAELLPNVERAMAWLTGHEGFIAYRPTGHGLANQGWKDSGDGVQYADGRIARAPLSLSEVQGYAYRAALDGAWLVEAFGYGTGERWRAWAKALAERFRGAFWCDDGYPVIALDGDGRQVDGPASNMGHLLGTGLLDGTEASAVTNWLTAPTLAGPFGVRTLATTAAGYNPISYHAGSVWPHDTVIAVLGLVRERQPAAAAQHIRALLAAAERFQFRLPELFGGDDSATPYPPSCRPQAWAAAVGPAIVTALLGVQADAPGGRLTIAPIAPSPVGAFTVQGLRVGSGALDVSVSATGGVTVHSAPTGLTVR